MVNQSVHIIMPVKDALPMAEQAIRAIVASGYKLTVYDDNSTKETAACLDAMGKELGIRIVHISEQTDHPSPNYRWVLIDAQKECLANGKNLVIVESDVIVGDSTISKLAEAVKPRIGLITAVTRDENGRINFPYEYARRIKADGVCKKRFSFCCTLLTNEIGRAHV